MVLMHALVLGLEGVADLGAQSTVNDHPEEGARRPLCVFHHCSLTPFPPIRQRSSFHEPSAHLNCTAARIAPLAAAASVVDPDFSENKG